MLAPGRTSNVQSPRNANRSAATLVMVLAAGLNLVLTRLGQGREKADQHQSNKTKPISAPKQFYLAAVLK
ncbi:hypothetical protein GGD65_002526 [Bradyrhizobium sp. CIR18]|nr:hypothetical protein [Bradyrhizobium sp. CIR18]